MTYVLVTFEVYGAEKIAFSTLDEIELENMIADFFKARKAEVSIEPDFDIDDSEETE